MATDPLLTPAAGLIQDATTETFQALVLEASRTAVVLVDFWAQWCGPCKTLTPLLEKTVAAYGGRVKLVKIDVDKNQMLASQFRVQSIPTVYAFIDGRPVDGFMGGVPESHLKAFIDKLLAKAGAPADVANEDITAMLDAADTAFEAGDFESVAVLLEDAGNLQPEHPRVLGGLARLLCLQGQVEAAEQILNQAPEEAAKDPAFQRARAAIALAKEAPAVDNLAALKAEVEANPGDHAKRFELAGGLMAQGDREGAVDHLLEIIQKDRNWNEGAARQRLLTLFEAIGLDDPFTVAARRRLSAILFS